MTNAPAAVSAKSITTLRAEYFSHYFRARKYAPNLTRKAFLAEVKQSAAEWKRTGGSPVTPQVWVGLAQGVAEEYWAGHCDGLASLRHEENYR
jgi:hypothetical protein